MSNLTRRAACAAFAAAAVVVATGCASAPSAPDQVRTVVSRYGTAVAARDYQRICKQLIAKQLSDRVEELGLPCELAFKKGLTGVVSPRLKVGVVRITGGAAYVNVHTTAANQPASDDTLKLIRIGGTWKILSLSAAVSPRSGTQSVPAPITTVPPGAIPGH